MYIKDSKFSHSTIIPERLDAFINKYAEHTHDKWAFEKVSEKQNVASDENIVLSLTFTSKWFPRFRTTGPMERFWTRTRRLTQCCGRTKRSLKRWRFLYFLKNLFLSDLVFFSLFFFGPQDKEIYRWPIKESIKAMLAWEWTLEKARDGEGEVEKASTRKISQTAQVQDTAEKYVFMGVFTLKKRK